MMNSVKRILINSVLGILLIVSIAIHIAFLCWEREGFAVGSEHVEWLRNRPVIGIFCYASEFADRYKLHGFFTSMFISNMQEAIIEQRDQGATNENIAYQQELFCNRVRKLIINNTPLIQWPEILQSQADLSLPFVRFNYEALTYYD